MNIKHEQLELFSAHQHIHFKFEGDADYRNGCLHPTREHIVYNNTLIPIDSVDYYVASGKPKNIFVQPHELIYIHGFVNIFEFGKDPRTIFLEEKDKELGIVLTITGSSFIIATEFGLCVTTVKTNINEVKMDLSSIIVRKNSIRSKIYNQLGGM